MPIPHDADWLPSTAFNADEDPVFDVESRAPQWPEEGIRTEDCDGPVSDLPVQDSIDGRRNHGSNADPEEAICTDRKELIERIKRGESPTWVPSNAVSGILDSSDISYEAKRGKPLKLRPMNELPWKVHQLSAGFRPGTDQMERDSKTNYHC